MAAPIVEVVRCPTCEEVVDPSMALRAGRTSYLLCWNGHRFGLDGRLVGVAGGPVGALDAPVALTARPSTEAGAG